MLVNCIIILAAAQRPSVFVFCFSHLFFDISEALISESWIPNKLRSPILKLKAQCNYTVKPRNKVFQRTIIANVIANKRRWHEGTLTSRFQLLPMAEGSLFNLCWWYNYKDANTDYPRCLYSMKKPPLRLLPVLPQHLTIQRTHLISLYTWRLWTILRLFEFS